MMKNIDDGTDGVARLLGFFVAPPPTKFDRIGMPWLLAYRGGARRRLWWQTGPRQYGLLLPKHVRDKLLGGTDADSTGREPLSGEPHA